MCSPSAATRDPHPLLLRTCIERLARDTNGGASAGSAEAATMEAVVQALEATQATTALDPDLLAGTWNQIYTNNPAGGTVAGDGQTSRRSMIGPVSGRVTQIVRLPEDAGTSGRYTQRAAAGRGLLEARLDAALEPLPYPGQGPLAWSVSFETFSWRALWRVLPLRARELGGKGGGEWRHTYVDANWRVMRAANRRGDGQETLYVLRRGS